VFSWGFAPSASSAGFSGAYGSAIPCLSLRHGLSLSHSQSRHGSVIGNMPWLKMMNTYLNLTAIHLPTKEEEFSCGDFIK